MNDLQNDGERILVDLAPTRLVNDHLERYNYVSRHCNNLKVLDIACGTGYGANILKSSGASVTCGIDISSSSIEYANNKYSSYNLHFKCGDIQNEIKINFTPDVIVCFETIEHVEDWKKSLISLSNVAKNNYCKLYISSPNRIITSPDAISINDKPRNKFHIHEFVPEELLDALNDVGFKCVEILGQRYQPYFNNAFLQKLYQKIFKPHIFSSFKLRKFIERRFLQPTYFLIVAEINKNI